MNEIHELLMRYSDSALRAAKQIQLKYDDLRTPVAENSFIIILSNREYLKTPFERRAEEIDQKLKVSLPLLFHSQEPKDENDFNDKVVALLKSGDERWFREYPTIAFGITHYRADGYYDGLIIESKYIRKNMPPSRATEGIAADITYLKSDQPVLFVVYDPERRITDDYSYCTSLMNKKDNCIVRLYR